MTQGGWIIMISSVSVVTTLFAWCIYKVLSTSKAAKVEGKEELKASNKRSK